MLACLLVLPLLVATTGRPASATVVATEIITDARHYVTSLPEAPRSYRGLTSGPGGNLWFLGHDDGINSGFIGKLDPVGHGIQTWAVPGGEFRSPTNITVAGDGTLWFTYFQHALVSRFDPGTQAFTTYPTSSATQDIGTGPDGSVWFTEPQPPSVFFSSGNYIGHVTLAGVLTEYPILTPVPSSAPAGNSIDSGITAGPDGNMWFNEKYQNKIGRITPSGVVTEFVVPTPDALTVDIASADGLLWFTESAVNKIGRLDPATGTFAEFFIGTGPEASPRLIVAGPDGHPWFSEGSDPASTAGYLARMNAAGTITQAVLIGGPDARTVDDQGATVTGGQGPDFLAVGPDGNLWWSLTGINAPRAGFARLVPPRQPPGPPTVRGMSPQAGTAAGSSRVVITGTGLTGASVRLDGLETTSTTDSDTRLTLVTPPRPAGTSVSISVLAPGSATPVSAGTFTYTAPEAPGGLTFMPSSASPRGGSIVTISGSDLEGATFDFGGIAVAATRGPSGGYNVTVPAATATPTVTVTATTPYGSTTAPFTYTTDTSRLGGPPELVFLDPDAGPPGGGSIGIYGHNFGPPGFHDAIAAVRFGTSDGSSFFPTYLVQSANDPNDPTLSLFEVGVPAHAPGTVLVTVTTEAGVSNALRYTFTDAARPEVTGISPDSGPEEGGTTTTITGTGFQAGTAPVQVLFGGTPARSVTVTSDTTIDVVTPPGVGFAPIRVRTEGGTSFFPYYAPQFGTRFAYLSSVAPLVTGLSPSTGSPDGGVFTIIGSHFLGATTVTFGDVAYPLSTDGSPTFNVLSDTRIEFGLTPPEPAGTTIQVRVTTPAGTSALTPADIFTYVDPPTLTGFAPGSPTSGSIAGGTHVTLLGQNLRSATVVSFGSFQATDFVAASDGTSIQVTSPPATGGPTSAFIQVQTPSGIAVASDPFTYTYPTNPVFQDFKFSPTPPNGGRVGVPYLDGSGQPYTIHATGDPAPTFAIGSGALPAGLTLNPTTGALTGTPTTAGTSTFTFRATNGVNPDAVTQPFQIIVAPEAPRAPTFTTSSPPVAATAGSPYGPYTFVATGNPGPITYDVLNGSLPPGLTLNATTGVLSGVPTTAGSSSFVVRATNGVGAGVTATITLQVAPAPPSAPSLTAASPGPGAVGIPYGPYTFTANGNPAPTFSVASGALPAGLSLSSSGVLTGTPTAVGTSPFTIRAANGVSPDAVSGSISITIEPAPSAPSFTAVSPTTSATVGQPYPTYTFGASGSPASTFSVASGVLPPGLSLSPSTGAMTGTPTATGSFAFTIRASNGVNPDAISSPITINVAAALVGSRFTPLSPARVWDSRSAPGPTGRVAAGSSRDVTVTGVGGVPLTGVTAVVLNVTAVDPSAATFVTAWPTGEARPLASNLNVPPGDTRPNLVTVKVGSGGKVSFYNDAGDVDLIADVAGWYGDAASQLYTPVSPARVWDSRSGPGPLGRLDAGGTRDLAVTGIGGVPAAGVTAVVLNVTAVTPSAGTFVTAWPTGEARPLASNLNVPPGDTRPNLVIVKVGAGGKASFYNNAGTTDLIADVAGYFTTTGSGFTSVSPTRLADTRFGPGAIGRVGVSGTREVTVTGTGNVPASGVTAVVLNVTAVGPSAPTFVTAWPTGEGRPLASNLNVPPGDTRPNLVTVKVGADGKVSLYNDAGTTDLVVDIAGWYGPPKA